MNDQNNEDFKDLETSLRSALSNEKQTGLSATQLNSLHLMIAKEEYRKTNTRPAWKNWLIPSSMLATAVVAFFVINRFPSSETNSVLTETSAPWVDSESSKVASNGQSAPTEIKVAKKKEVKAETPQAASAPVLAESKAKPTESTRNRAGPKQESPKKISTDPEKISVAKDLAPKLEKEKSWESKGTAVQNNLTPPKGLGGSTSSFGSLANSKSESVSGSGSGKSASVSLKKSDQKVASSKIVSLIQASNVSTDTAKKLTGEIAKLSNCNDLASTWKISFEILKSGKITSPKLVPESGGSDEQKLCINGKMAKWNLGSTSIGPVHLTVKFSGK
jgi:hypothetical protein